MQSINENIAVPLVLVVDPEENIIGFIRLGLRYEGYRVESCTRGLEALQAIGQLKPDLVILELALPDIAGEELCRQLRANETTHGLPIIVLTQEENLQQAARAAGANAIIIKPFDFVELVEQIKSLTWFLKPALNHQRARDLADKDLFALPPRHNHNRLEAVQQFARAAVQGMQEILGERLLAVYLHGSVASGDFVQGKSDLDLLAIIQDSLTAAEKAAVRSWFVQSKPPQILNGIDCSLLTKQAAVEPAQQPHWDTLIRGQRTQQQFAFFVPDNDADYTLLDLALTREHGLTLRGPAPANLLGPLPRTWLLAACIANLRKWAQRDIFYDPDAEVLTACRAWYYLDEGVLSTKSAAGLWAISQSPTYAPLIDAAFDVRRNIAGSALSNREVKGFCQHVLRRLELASRATDI